jgi:hypothetical protein
MSLHLHLSKNLPVRNILVMVWVVYSLRLHDRIVLYLRMFVLLVRQKAVSPASILLVVVIVLLLLYGDVPILWLDDSVFESFCFS